MSYYYNVENDLKRLLFDEEREQKQRQLKRRIVNFILESEKENRLKRFDEVVMYLERTYWQHRETKGLSAYLLQELSAELFKRQQLEFLLKVFTTLIYVEKEADPFKLMLTNGNAPKEELLAAARRWFLVEFLRCAGKTLERSMQLALFLLEQFSLGGEITYRDYHNKISKGQQLGSATQPAMAAFLIIFLSATCPPHPDIPQKLWLEKLIEGAQKDRVVGEVLASVKNILVLHRPDDKCLVYGLEDTSSKAIADILAKQFTTPGNWQASLFNPYMLLKKEHDELLMAWWKEWTKKTDQEKEEGERILKWFGENFETIDKIFLRKCQEIVEQPRRGLRPNGYDHIDVNITPLRNIGIRSIVFHPEGQMFPDVGLDIIVRKETPHLFSFPASLENFQLDISFDAFYNATHQSFEKLFVLLNFIIVDIMHRIIVEGKELRAKKKWMQTGDETIEMRPKTIPVRPFIRHLPEGYKASEEAKARGEAYYGWKLPPGVTFVATHYRGQKLEYGLPTSPVAIYSDEDLFEIGGLYGN